MKITAKRIKKRWIAGGIVIVAAAVGITLFVKAKGSKDTVNAGSGQQSTVQLSKQDLVESISATGTFESATNKSVTSTATNLTVKKVLVAVGDTVQCRCKRQLVRHDNQCECRGDKCEETAQ